MIVAWASMNGLSISINYKIILLNGQSLNNEVNV